MNKTDPTHSLEFSIISTHTLYVPPRKVFHQRLLTSSVLLINFPLKFLLKEKNKCYVAVRTKKSF